MINEYTFDWQGCASLLVALAIIAVAFFGPSKNSGGRVRRVQQTKIVKTENDLLAMCADMNSSFYGSTEYVVDVDAREWDFKDQLNLTWVENNPSDNVVIQRIVK